LALLTLLTLLTILTILTVAACPAEATVSTDCQAVDNCAIQDDWSTIGIEIHRASVGGTTIATGQAGLTIKTIRPRLTRQTVLAILTVKTIYRLIGVFRQFRPVGVVRRPMVRVVRVGYRGILWRVKWVQRIQGIFGVIRIVIDDNVVLTVLTSGDDVFDDQMRQSWTAAVKAGYCSAEGVQAVEPRAID